MRVYLSPCLIEGPSAVCLLINSSLVWAGRDAFSLLRPASGAGPTDRVLAPWPSWGPGTARVTPTLPRTLGSPPCFTRRPLVALNHRPTSVLVEPTSDALARPGWEKRPLYPISIAGFPTGALSREINLIGATPFWRSFRPISPRLRPLHPSSFPEGVADTPLRFTVPAFKESSRQSSQQTKKLC